MNEGEARSILAETLRPDGAIESDEDYVYFKRGDNGVTLDGYFGARYLEALAWWMRRDAENGARGRELR